MRSRRELSERCRSIALDMMGQIDQKKLQKKNLKGSEEPNYQVTPETFEELANLLDEVANRLG